MNRSEHDRGVELTDAPWALPDLSSRADVHDLVIEFYRDVAVDDLLGPVFVEVGEVDWVTHIPKLIDYWCRILLLEGDHTGAVTAAHRQLHGREPIRVEHCDRWYALWVRAVRSRWSGPTAEQAITHARLLMSGMAKHIFGFEWAP